jgi:hypothetical protein
MTIQNPTHWRSLIRQPAAYGPIVMSTTALLILLIHIAKYGYGTEVDEGAAAHLWQLLMVGQIPVIFFFLVRRLRTQSLATIEVLGLQILAAALSCAPVFLLGL